MSIHNDESITLSHKRTRDDSNANEIDTTPFTIREPSDPFARPRAFIPLQLISRAQLPLSCLDPAPLSSGRLFSAHIRALEAAHAFDDDVRVLLARDEKDQRLYAVERVNRGTYAICRLVQGFHGLESSDKRQGTVHPMQSATKRHALQSVENGQPWWSNAAVKTLPVPSDIKTLDFPKFTMRRVMEATPKVSTELHLTCTASARSMPEVEPGSAQTDAIVQMTAEAVLQELSKQYLDALYLSRTSLAYFSKGPLSRARTAFSAAGSDLDIMELVDFLRESILTSNVMDKKYKDNISDFVKELSPSQHSKEVGQPSEPAKKRRKKRKWKAKRDKAGLFVDEQDYVERWWQNADNDSLTETCNEGLRRRLPKIRNRETFLQIIILLEVLALESSSPSDYRGKVAHVDSQAAETQEGESQLAAEPQITPQPRKKKPQNLSSLLDTLLDKLCIWHSLLDSNSPVKTRDHDASTGQEETKDELKSFCVEIVVPFYVSRIPHYAAIVNKKLGGPSAPTPIKRKTNSSSKTRPGEPAGRNVPEKVARAPLSRVESETLHHTTKHRVPNLQRSATDSIILDPFIKREGSESIPPMDSIPAAKTAPRKRANIMQNLSFSKREVDLSAMSQASEAKMRKKAEVEEKLREAISTLKKPNRAMAVKEIAESTDAKMAASKLKTQRERKVVQSTPIHVTATPGGKYPRTVKGTPYQKRSSHVPGTISRAHIAGDIPSSTPAVPQTTQRSQDTNSGPAAVSYTGNTVAIPQTGHRNRYAAPLNNMEETPSRGFAKFMPMGLARQPGTLDSPIDSRKTSVLFQTPSKSASSISKFAGVAATPVRPLGVASPNSRQWMLDRRKDDVDGKQGSIYDSLGWNDDEGEELV